MQWANSSREERKEMWADGVFSAAFETEMIVKNAGATGYCSALKDLINIEASDLFGEK